MLNLKNYTSTSTLVIKLQHLRQMGHQQWKNAARTTEKTYIHTYTKNCLTGDPRLDGKMMYRMT